MKEDFLQVIRANPNDDSPRLVFADWLEEHGDADRAEFIRVQCELARLPPADQRAAALRRRSVQMQAEYEREWLGGWSDDLVRWQFGRGLLEEITIQPGPFLARSSELFRQHPIKRVDFVNDEGARVSVEVGAELVRSPNFAHVRSLEIGFQWCDWLARATHVNRLEELVIRGAEQENEARHLVSLADLAAAPHLGSLHSLTICPSMFTTLGDAVVDVLAEAVFAPRLRSLHLEGVAMTEAGARRLANTPAFSRIRNLDLSRCERISRGGIEAIFESPYLKNISELGVNGRVDLARLASWPGLSNLSALQTVTAWDAGSGGGDPNDPEGWSALASAPDLRLRRLNLLLFLHDVDGLTCLINSPGLNELQEFTLYASADGDFLPEHSLVRSMIGKKLGKLSWGDQAFEPKEFPITSWDGLSRLAELSLVYELYDSRRLQTIFASPMFPESLSSLSLGFQLSENDLAAIAQCEKLGSLQSLWIDVIEMTDKSATALAQSPHLAKLEKLRISCFASENKPDFRPFATCEGFHRLRDLEISHINSVDSTTRELLRRRFGPCLHYS